MKKYYKKSLHHLLKKKLVSGKLDKKLKHKVMKGL